MIAENILELHLATGHDAGTIVAGVENLAGRPRQIVIERNLRPARQSAVIFSHP